jgi:hypothetical protein
MHEEVGLARRRRRSAPNAEDVLAGLPQTMNSAFTPPGQIEQWGRSPGTCPCASPGWKHAVTGVGWILVAIPIAIVSGPTLLHR